MSSQLKGTPRRRAGSNGNGRFHRDQKIPRNGNGSSGTEILRAGNGIAERPFALHEIIVGPDGQPSDYRFLSVNRSFEELLGLPADQIIGRTIRQIMGLPADGWIKTYHEVHTTGATTTMLPLSNKAERLVSVRGFAPNETHLAILVEDPLQQSQETEARLQIEQYLARFIEETKEVYLLLDSRGKIAFLNPAFEAKTGWERSQWIGRSVFDLIHPDDRKQAHVAYARAMERQTVGTLELRALTQSGEAIYTECSLTPQMAEGTVSSIVAIARDVTERKSLEILHQALYEISAAANESGSLAEFYACVRQTVRKILPTRSLVIWLANGSARPLEPSFPSPGTQDGEQLTAVSEVLAGRVFRSGDPILLTCDELKALTSDGTLPTTGLMPTCWLGIPLRAGDRTVGVLEAYSNGECSACSRRHAETLSFIAPQIALAIDRKRSEQSLRSSERLLRDVVDAAPFGAHIYELHADGRLVFVGSNSSADRILGLDHDNFVGKTIEEAFPPLAQTDIPGRYRHVVETGKRYDCETVNYEDGRTSGIFEVTAIKTAENVVTVFFRDITDRKRAEEAINLERTRLRQLFENSPTAIAVLTPDDHVLDVNKSFERVFGYPIGDAQGRDINELVVPDDKKSEGKELTKLALEGKQVRQETIRRRKDGLRVPVAVFAIPIRVNGTTVGAYAMYQDLTEKKRIDAIQDVLLRISQAALSSTSLKELLTIVHEQLTRLIDTTNFFVALYDAHIGKYSFPFYVDEFDELADFEPKDLSKSLTDYVRRSGAPLYVTQTKHDELVRTGEIKLVGTPSPIWMGVPLKTSDAVIGVVAVQSYSNAELYTKSDLDLLTLVSDKVAQAIQRKRVEEELRENEERLRVMFEFGPTGYFTYELNGNLLDANRAAEVATGYQRADLIGKNLLSSNLLPKDEVVRGLAVLAKNVQGEPTGPDEFTFCRKDGGSAILEVSTYPINLRSHSIVLATVRDVTRKKFTESQIRLQSTALEAAANGIVITDRDGTILWINPAFTAMTGFASTDVLGQDIRVLSGPDRFSSTYDTIWTVVRSSRQWQGELVSRRKDGSLYVEEMTVTPVRSESGEISHVVAIKQEITERKRAEEKMREQAALLDEAQDAIIVRGFDGSITFWNKGAERLYGWTIDEVRHDKTSEFLFTDLSNVLEAQREVLEKGSWSGELRQATKGGATIIVQSRWTLVKDDHGKPKSVLIINTDMTEKRSLESQFLRSQRMESIGILAGGIAHDLNNVLAPILMAVQVLQRKLSDDQSRQVLSTLEQSARRGSNIVKQVLTFARGLEGDRVLIQPRHLIREISSIVGETFPKSISVRSDAERDLWAVWGDPTQLHQVLLNLCVNARDAMPNGGTLTIGAQNVLLDAHYAKMNVDAKAGPYVVISVCDTGTGIEPRILDKIFEPFFTTKEPGKGTGLGLSTVYSIVKSHSGFVHTASEVGKGTTFTVYLPAQKGNQGPDPVPPQPVETKGNGETILVVDDEVAVRDVSKLTLESHGYNVLLAADGTEAIALYTRNRDHIAAVVLDMMMPFMDGSSAIRALRKINPDVRIIIASGHDQTGVLGERNGLTVEAFLLKPYTAEKLLKTLTQVLEGSPRP